MEKKTYLVPELFAVTFSTKTSILQASLPVVQDGETIDDPNQILTKENKDVNVWAEER